MYSEIATLLTSVADPDPGGLFDPWTRIPDPESWIPDPHIFEGLVTNFGVKSSINSLKPGPNFFSSAFQKSNNV